MYDQLGSAEITLINSGKVGFEFVATGMDPAMAKRPLPGVPIMIPHSGYIEPLSEQKLTVKYLPGIPEAFSKDFIIQVAHFEPDVISLKGDGVFPRISLDLPRTPDSYSGYHEMIAEARKNLHLDAPVYSKAPPQDRPQSCLPSSQRAAHDALAQVKFL